jgi:F-type H+-transporting ATPase subunit gamma
MPSLIDIRRRVRAVKSTQQITKAMKMIDAARLRRAQERIVNARPFAQQMLRVLNSLASRVDPSAHPLLAQPDETQSHLPTLLILITADRGFAGSFNTNAIKAASTFMREQSPRAFTLALVGRKGRDFFKRRSFTVRYEAIGIFSKLKLADAQAIARVAIEDFVAHKVSSVYLVYNEFKSVMQQRVATERLLPIPRSETELETKPETTPESESREPRVREPHGSEPQGPQVDYLYEPKPVKILRDLIPRHIEVQIYRALMESAAAEHAARMTAMDTATRNAGEMIDQLTLYMNKVRQAAITREIIEVVSGAEAL